MNFKNDYQLDSPELMFRGERLLLVLHGVLSTAMDDASSVIDRYETLSCGLYMIRLASLKTQFKSEYIKKLYFTALKHIRGKEDLRTLSSILLGRCHKIDTRYEGILILDPNRGTGKFLSDIWKSLITPVYLYKKKFRHSHLLKCISTFLGCLKIERSNELCIIDDRGTIKSLKQIGLKTDELIRDRRINGCLKLKVSSYAYVTMFISRSGNKQGLFMLTDFNRSLPLLLKKTVFPKENLETFISKPKRTPKFVLERLESILDSYLTDDRCRQAMSIPRMPTFTVGSCLENPRSKGGQYEYYRQKVIAENGSEDVYNPRKWEEVVGQEYFTDKSQVKLALESILERGGKERLLSKTHAFVNNYLTHVTKQCNSILKSIPGVREGFFLKADDEEKRKTGAADLIKRLTQKTYDHIDREYFESDFTRSTDFINVDAAQLIINKLADKLGWDSFEREIALRTVSDNQADRHICVEEVGEMIPETIYTVPNDDILYKFKVTKSVEFFKENEWFRKQLENDTFSLEEVVAMWNDYVASREDVKALFEAPEIGGSPGEKNVILTESELETYKRYVWFLDECRKDDNKAVKRRYYNRKQDEEIARLRATGAFAGRHPHTLMQFNMNWQHFAESESQEDMEFLYFNRLLHYQIGKEPGRVDRPSDPVYDTERGGWFHELFEMLNMQRPEIVGRKSAVVPQKVIQLGDRGRELYRSTGELPFDVKVEGGKTILYYRQRRGTQMGLKLSFIVLMFLHLAGAVMSGNQSMSCVFGDDIIACWSRTEQERYYKAMESFGFLINRKKTFRSYRYSLFCGTYFDLRCKTVVNRIEWKSIINSKDGSVLQGTDLFMRLKEVNNLLVSRIPNRRQGLRKKVYRLINSFYKQELSQLKRMVILNIPEEYGGFGMLPYGDRVSEYSNAVISLFNTLKGAEKRSYSAAIQSIWRKDRKPYLTRKLERSIFQLVDKISFKKKRRGGHKILFDRIHFGQPVSRIDKDQAISNRQMKVEIAQSIPAKDLVSEVTMACSSVLQYATNPDRIKIPGRDTRSSYQRLRDQHKIIHEYAMFSKSDQFNNKHDCDSRFIYKKRNSYTDNETEKSDIILRNKKLELNAEMFSSAPWKYFIKNYPYRSSRMLVENINQVGRGAHISVPMRILEKGFYDGTSDFDYGILVDSRAEIRASLNDDLSIQCETFIEDNGQLFPGLTRGKRLIKKRKRLEKPKISELFVDPEISVRLRSKLRQNPYFGSTLVSCVESNKFNDLSLILLDKDINEVIQYDRDFPPLGQERTDLH